MCNFNIVKCANINKLGEMLGIPPAKHEVPPAVGECVKGWGSASELAEWCGGHVVKKEGVPTCVGTPLCMFFACLREA